MVKYTQLSFEERVQIELLKRSGVSMRSIAAVLGRSPNTISRELKEKLVSGVYLPKKAQHKTYRRRYQSKRQCLKVGLNPYLAWFVDVHLRARWSPERIAGYLRGIGYAVSTKAIYRFVYARSLEGFLLFRMRRQKPKRYRPQWGDGRLYIEDRPSIDCSGHFEADFVVSSHNQSSLLVVVDKHTRRTWIERVPNRKHAVVTRAFKKVFARINVRTLTLDNDIAFAKWRTLERVLGAAIYFTHPYRSWEKGLVENTNRWIRLFVPKQSDIALVSPAKLERALQYLNEIPRQCLGYRTAATVYHQCPS
jgi:transposase, IS30 family